MNKYFVLQIKDNEDDFVYQTLLYESFDDCCEAADLVRKLNKNWYDNVELEGLMSFDEYIVEKLKENSLYGIEVSTYNCYVR